MGFLIIYLMPDHYHLCIIIPCYNNRYGLIETMKSIVCGQSTLILIIDDGSSDPLNAYELQSVTLHSVLLIQQPVNRGIVHALNTGLDKIGKLFTTSFVARIDCSDICRKDRFEKQLACLSSDPDLILVGSWCTFFDPVTSRSFIFKTPVEHKKILAALHFRNVFVHPSVMWRVTDDVRYYSGEFPHAEDYAFFYEMCLTGQARILPYPLVRCALSGRGISSVFRKEQLRSREKVILKYSKSGLLKFFGILRLRMLRLIPFHVMVKIKMSIYKYNHSENLPV